MRELLEVKEPEWYQMGLYLDPDDPASHVANFGAPNSKASELSKTGYASVEASSRIASSYPEHVSRQAAFGADTRLPEDECPLRKRPRCPPASRRYRTADGTCNNFKKAWKGAALLPMQRFLPPNYHDGIQEVRRSVFRRPLPSARQISSRVHRDRSSELTSVNLMFMQWGQFLDHDLVSTVKSRSFNGSVPRCCARGGHSFLPPEHTHPSCLPIEVPPDDWFLSSLGIRCLEFTRSAPSTRIDCDLGWREQINQATSYLDASTIYGSDVDTSDIMRTFRKGKLQYGRPKNAQPPDPPGGEICREGALTTDCLQPGDGRFGEQPGLTAFHIVWLRYHNGLAGVLSQMNRHWGDEKVYQETRRIVAALMQHITYREFLPILLGQEVMSLFGLSLERKGYHSGYDVRVDPTIANSFATAAFRFGHSLVQNSFVRFDVKHRPLFNNVSLHEEQANFENIWSFGSLDRLLLGFSNQPSQNRDEFICDELTNHLFQTRGLPFGMDLAAINIQRGRDHGLRSYTSWREPCGLTAVTSWKDLERIMNVDTARRFQSLYEHVDDIDLFSGGLAEKPVRGGLVGPTFACIIAQQFLNLKRGDRFWYENGAFESSFTPAQLQQLRHVTFAHVLCQSLTEIDTIQPFVFLAPDDVKNARVGCDSAILNNFDLSPWEEGLNEARSGRRKKKKRKVKRKPGTVGTSTSAPLVKIKKKQQYVLDSYVVSEIPPRPTFDTHNDRRTTLTYLFGVVDNSTPNPNPKPFEVNIKIQYYPPTTERPHTTRQRPNYYDATTEHAYSYSDDFSVYKRPYKPSDFYGTRYQPQQVATSKRPYIYNFDRDNSYDNLYSQLQSGDGSSHQYDLPKPFKTYAAPHVEKPTTDKHDSFNFNSGPTKFVKISSVKGQEFVHSGATVQWHVAQREGDLELDDEVSTTTTDVRLVDYEMIPSETKWLLYNATDEEVESVHIPDVNLNVSCSSELPKPFNFTFY